MRKKCGIISSVVIKEVRGYEKPEPTVVILEAAPRFCGAKFEMREAKVTVR